MRLTHTQQTAIRESALFLCVASPAFWTNPLAQAQLAYAMALHKPIRVLRLSGARIPEEAFQGVQDLAIAESQGKEADVKQIEAWLRAVEDQP